MPDDGEGSEESLERQRLPELSEGQSRRRRRRCADPLGIGEGEDELAASAPLLARMSPPGPALAADSIDLSAGRGRAPVPGF